MRGRSKNVTLDHVGRLGGEVRGGKENLTKATIRISKKKVGLIHTFSGLGVGYIVAVVLVGGGGKDNLTNAYTRISQKSRSRLKFHKRFDFFIYVLLILWDE